MIAIEALRTVMADAPRDEEATVTVVGANSAAGLEELAPLIDSAARDLGWRVKDVATDRLLDGCRRFDGAGPHTRYARTRTTRARLRMDRTDAMLALFTKSASPRVRVLLTSARELLGRVVRDWPLLAQIAEQCRPVEGVLAGDPGTWRGAVVALGLLGIAPAQDDVDAAMAGDRLTGAAVGLAAVLAMGNAASTILGDLIAGGGEYSTAAAVARARLLTGRVTGAVA